MILLLRHPLHRLAAAAAMLALAAAPALARPTPQQEAAGVDARVAALSAADPDARALAREWLLNTYPTTLPAIERAATAAGPDSPVGKQLAPILDTLRRLGKIRTGRAVTRFKTAAWNRTAALDAFDKFGWHDPSWDAAAREAIGQFYSPDPAERAKAVASLEHAATVLHCTDPTVMLLQGIELSRKGNDKPWPIRSFNAYLTSRFHVLQSDYPAFVKAEALGRSCWFIENYQMLTMDPKLATQVKSDAAKLLELWPEVLKTPDLPFDRAYSIGGWVLDAQALDGADRGKVLYDTVLPALARTYPGNPGVKAFEGAQLVAWGWDARGGGWANTVTPEGWRLLRERLDKADAVMTAAWKADPMEVTYPLMMLSVGLGNDFPEPQMKLWFTRAVRADPDADRPPFGLIQDPYEIRRETLQPKWGGSREQLLAFGRECLAGRNWAGGAPYELVYIHEKMAADSPDPDAYYRLPDVWPDVDAVFTGVLRVWPDDAWLRTRRAMWAYRCGQWAEADKAFKRLGDRADPDAFDATPESLAAARRECAEKAK